MTKKELALEVIRRLKAEYPDSECSLDYDDAWKLLVSVRLAVLEKARQGIYVHVCACFMNSIMIKFLTA